MVVKEERTRTLCYFLCRGSEEERKRLQEVRNRNFVTSFTEYNKDKVPVDVATSLVVNHVNIGVLCPFMLCCVYVYGKVTYLDNT